MDGAHCGGPHARRAVEGRGAEAHRRETEALHKVVEGDLDQVLLRQVLAAEVRVRVRVRVGVRSRIRVGVRVKG